MKKMILAFLMAMISVLLLYPQDPSGKWVNSNFNITLILKNDMTYLLSHSNGNSKGIWSSSGSQFCLKDASAYQPVCYTVISYSATELVLRDMNGVIIDYKKEQAMQRSAEVQEVFKKKSEDRMIAEKNGHTLTASHLETGIDLIQFVVGQKIRESEIRELQAKLEEEFLQMPGEVLNQLNGIEGAMKKVNAATDPYLIGLVRQELYTAFYKATMNIAEKQKPLIIQIINRYVKVLAYDETNNLLLTNRDVEGYINYLAFNSELAGQKLMVNDAVRREFTMKLVQEFSAMPLEQKRLLASASLVWQLLDGNWNRLTPAQKNQYVIAYRNQISGKFSHQPQNYGQQYTPPQGSQKKSLSEMRREFNAKQNMFQMMQNMNTNTHALSLNIIENIGGTGNYWEVVDY